MGPDWAFVLDGATPAPGVATGCRHGVPWLVQRLAGALAARLTLAAAQPVPGSLASLLAGAIGEVRDVHAGTCDLANPDSPSATVALARLRGRTVEYLVLCDSPILLRHVDGRFTLVADDRLARLTAAGRPYPPDLVRARRNRPGGFWVASTDPAAAYQAVRGRAGLDGLTDVALFSDGVARLAEWYGYSWANLLERLRALGPAGLIGLVRAAERAHPHPRAKQHDDATAVHIRL